MLLKFLVALFGFLFMSVPIAFALILTTMVLMFATDTFSAAIITQNIIRGIDNFPLMAIPFFIMAGELMNVGGISRRIVEFARSFVGRVTGGLGYVAVASSMIFAGVSGSAIADTSAIGSIMLPIMEKEGYDKKTSTALICAAGTIGPVIPPSIPMILYGVIAGVSISEMFLGGIIPGILIGVGLMTVWGMHAKKMGYKSTEKVTMDNLIKSGIAAFWAIMLPPIILGGILSGVFTATEAAIIAVVYSLVIGFFAYKELKIRHLPGVLIHTAKGTAVVMMVCGTATAAGYVITTAHIPELLTTALLALGNDNIYVIMFLINILLLLVGCVMDLTPALLILAPILLPITTGFGIDPVHFGVIMVCNLCIGIITPPVGTVLYVGCGLSKLSIGELVPPLLKFIAVMVAVLFLITYFPALVMFIPNLVS